MTQRYLFIADQALFAGSACRDLLDMALSAAAFDQPASLLLRGPATLWVATSHARPGAIGHKDLFRQLGALPVYGIEPIHVAEDDFRRFASEPPMAGCLMLDEAGVAALIREHDRVIQL
ncbi:MAG: hypothetical protein R3296_10150 [Oleiphilaceae bacterium]|nr:hypothetical protein [Oleiphilaceae bacterium]